MGVLHNFFYDLVRPLRELRSKFHSVKNVRDGLVGDLGRIKKSVGIPQKPAAGPAAPADPAAPPPPVDPSKKP
jgi:hypothetical protein